MIVEILSPLGATKKEYDESKAIPKGSFRDYLLSYNAPEVGLIKNISNYIMMANQAKKL